MNEETKIILLGTGAVGSYFCGRLSKTGVKVCAVCRSDFDEVSHSGIHIRSVEGDFTFTPDETVRHAKDCSFDADYIVIATKALPDIDLPSLINPAVKPNTAIVLIQNGIDIEEPLYKAFPENEIISGIAFIAVSRESYGTVNHMDFGRITLGSFPAGVSDKTKKLGSLFEYAGVPCILDENIRSARWKKLIWNIPYNPISVLAGQVTTEDMMATPENVETIRRVMKEVTAAAASDGCPLSDDIIEKNLSDTAGMPPYKPSMLLDYENRRPMEVEAIVGNALRIAEKNGVETPLISFIYSLLLIADRTNAKR